MKILGALKKGLVFVISAPAGTGKTTLVRMLTEEFSCVAESVSYTTRTPRPNEINGKDYYFVSEDEFERMIHNGDFLEYAHVFGQYYGTSKRAVEKQQEARKHVALVIDTQGALQIKEKIEAVYIFIRPPNLNELKRRLEGRKSESIEAIRTRLSWAEEEIAKASLYHYQILNEDLQTAYAILRSIFIAEEHKTQNIASAL